MMKTASAKQKAKGKQTTTIYITKRIIINSSRSAVRSAANRAMKTAGYVIKAKNGWIIRENQDGTTEKIRRYRKTTHPVKVVLD